ncbi:activating signal cointegrator 1 complex subunit 1 isoform X2 [Prorops nasuta]
MCDQILDDDYMDIEIKPYGSRFKHTFYVPRSMLGYIIGAKHATRKKLESDTGTTIQIPKHEENSNITIIGSYQKGITSARRKIDFIIENSRFKLDMTHFISIPVNNQDIMDNFESFKMEVINNCGKNSNSAEENIFQKSKKLHLTICVFVLLDDNEKEKLVNHFIDCEENIIKPALEKTGPIKIKLQGIDCMNDDPTEVQVLYAKIVESEKIQSLVNEIAESFSKTGVMKPNRGKNVKLHVTLMNTKFLQEENQWRRIKFDASDILKQYENFYFGELTLNEIHLSKRSESKIRRNEYYEAIAKIEL